MTDKKGLIEKVESTEILSSSWKEKLAKYAQESKKFAEDSGGGLPFFSLSNRTLKWQGEKIKHNALIAIVLAQRFEYTYYTSKYSADNPVPPACFAIGKDSETLAPHDNSSEKQNDTCTGCPKNEWGSADGDSRAKACSNAVRISLLPAGMFVPDDNPKLFTDVGSFSTEEIGYLRIPVTSTKNFTKFIRLSSSAGLPPFAFYTKIEVVDDDKTLFKLVFTPIKPIMDEDLLTVLEKRLHESEQEIETPYDKALKEEEVDDQEEARNRKF